MVQSAPPNGYDDVTLNPATVSISDGDRSFVTVTSAYRRIMTLLTNE